MLEEDRSRVALQLQAAEKQAEVLRLQAEQEKLRLGNAEKLLAEQRAMQHKADIYVRELEDERNKLRDEVEQLKAKMTGRSMRLIQ